MTEGRTHLTIIVAVGLLLMAAATFNLLGCGRLFCG